MVIILSKIFFQNESNESCAQDCMDKEDGCATESNNEPSCQDEFPY